MKKKEKFQDLRLKKTLFAYWYSIPGQLRNSKYFKVSKFVDPSLEPEIQEKVAALMHAKTHADAAKIIGTAQKNFTLWKEDKEFKELLTRFDSHNNSLKFKRDVDYSFTQATIKHADAARVKLWKQLYEGWVEKTANTIDFDESNILGIQNRLRELAEKKDVKKMGVEELKQEINGLPEGTNEFSGADTRRLGVSEKHCKNAV